MIALDYKLRLGTVQQTHHVIRNRIEDNVTLMDIIENALSIELEHGGKRFILLDEFGKLSLRAADSPEMDSGIVLNKGTVGSVSFFSSVDKRSNRVKVSRYDRKSGKREIYVAKDSSSESKLGVLQSYAKIADPEEVLSVQAKAILALHNKDERFLSVRNALGDAGVRGGSTVIVNLDELKGRTRVLRCLHRLSGNQHFMDLDLGV